MRKTLAKRKYYFDPAGVQIAVRRVRSGPGEAHSHPHDLTELQHQHDFHELALVARGRGLHRLGDAEYPVAAGDVFLLQAEQRHSFAKREGLELVNIMYAPENLRLPESGLRKLSGYCALFLLEPGYRQRHRFASRLRLGRVELAHALQLASGIERELADRAEGYDILAVNRLLELIVFLSRRYSESDTEESQALLRVGSVIGALERDFRREWRLEELLEISHMSRSNFLRVFHRATGHSPIDYLIRLRVEQAMPLLRNGRRGILDIALAVGFRDSNYFSRQFKKLAGVTPREYRNG